MSQLATSPETASMKTSALAAAQNLSTQVSSLANNVETLRFNADTQIGQSVNTVNQDLKTIYNLNIAVLNSKTNGTSSNGLEDSIDAAMKDISNQMDITYKTEANGTVSISTTSGVQLVGDGNLTQLDYTPAASAASFANNIPSGAIKVYAVDANGNKEGTGIPIVSAGVGSQVKSSITGGAIAGLLQVRDQAMPDVLSQLDNLASNVTSSVNAISNNGTGYPPPQTLTGTTLVDPTSTHAWSGSVMIAALDSSGNAVASPYASDTT